METTLNEETLSELAALGVIYGHKKSKTHPLMKPLVIDNRNEIEILNPEEVLASLERAIQFLTKKKSEGMLMLLVGTTPVAKGAILNLAQEFNFPYVVNRWLGGTITNFKMIEKRIAYYQDLKNKKEKGELQKYTKKEQLEFSREIERLREKFEGLVQLTKIPDVLFVVDINEHHTAVREAKAAGVPIVAIIDNDDNPSLVDWPIYASDHSKKSIEWIIGKVREALKDVNSGSSTS